MATEGMKNEVDIDDWVQKHRGEPVPKSKGYVVRMWCDDGFDDKQRFDDPKPTGRQVLEQFDRRPSDEFELLILTYEGQVESVGLHETVDLRAKGPERFFAFKTDRTYKVSINGQRFPWGAPTIGTDILRLIGRIPDDHDLYLEKKNNADEQLTDDAAVKLSGRGLERVVSTARTWRLNVQGVILTLAKPIVAVKDALLEAGFDPNRGWNAILKVKGEPKRPVDLTDEIDLRLPGIEKLRLSPKVINNGDATTGLRREYSLLTKDENFLNALGIRWETFVDGKRRWLFLHDFAIPAGLSHDRADVAIDVPPTYPQAEIDMFFCSPHLTRADGGQIGETTGRASINGREFQQWSRHLNGATRWDPSTDSVMTHVALIEDALLREGADG